MLSNAMDVSTRRASPPDETASQVQHTSHLKSSQLEPTTCAGSYFKVSGGFTWQAMSVCVFKLVPPAQGRVCHHAKAFAGWHCLVPLDGWVASGCLGRRNFNEHSYSQLSTNFQDCRRRRRSVASPMVHGNIKTAMHCRYVGPVGPGRSLSIGV